MNKRSSTESDLIVQPSAMNQVVGDGRYNLLADCYRAAARKIGEVPSKVQAVTWVAHIERK
ncbi:DUF7178 family protein [Streptomyces flaveolus]|uniref:DUF7178 family protein n=1 Tax=Streptomyces flaveolus TaxID=67297 RepID=UPI003F4CFCCA